MWNTDIHGSSRLQCIRLKRTRKLEAWSIVRSVTDILFFSNRPPRFHFSRPENYISMYHQEGSDTLYVGGRAVIYALKFTNRGVFDVQVELLECDNFITVLQKVNDTFIVCGTNAGSPRCWMLVNDTVLTDVQGGHIASASDISPPYPSQKFISLPADGSLYSAMSVAGGQSGSIRRTFGPQKLLKTENVWLLNPQFAGAAIIPSSEKYKEEIYFFFSEFNQSAKMDEEPFRARIGRVCTVDEGGIMQLLPNSWTTFMKARVMCGAGNTQQQYNNLKQAAVVTAQEQRAGIMYGLFSNAWGKKVICAYSIEDINKAFSTSRLKGYSSPLSGNRPGMCARKGSISEQNLIKNLGVIRYNPEIEDVIRPVGVAPLDLPTDDEITHTLADITLAVNDEHYTVLYLGTEQGKVLKAIHTNQEVFIISQYSLFHNEGPVLNMAIDSQKGHLYVGTAMEIQRLPLADCSRYGDTCRDCILSRDPYCGWDKARRKCRRTSPKEVVIQSNTSVFLPCPVRSFHAFYRWEKDNCIKNYPCLFSGDFCVLGPLVDTPLKEGVFRCMATEDGFKVEVISFRLVNDGRLLSASIASTFGLSLLLAVATLWLH
uniref:Si:ch211-113g11.6 n=1 Tax=Oryzias latipes TaxID=8090 RepID=A0A3P9L226_ORYLA